MTNSNNSLGVIYVENKIQKALLEGELFGQFSDGRWENSRNLSWKFWNSCDVEIGDSGYEKTGKYSGTIKSYNCDDAELLSYIGTRLLGAAKFVRYFDVALTQEEYRNIEYIVGCKNTNRFGVITEDIITDTLINLSDEYWAEEEKSFKEFLEKYTISEILTALNSPDYSKKDLKKDLRGITSSLSNQY